MENIHNQNELEKTFVKIQDELKQEMTDQSFFENFIKPLKFLECVDHTIFLVAPNEFKQQVLNSEHKNLFVNKFQEHLNGKFEILFVLDKSFKLKNISKQNQGIGLFKNYTFDNFVVGEFNKSAYNALKLVLKNPK